MQFMYKFTLVTSTVAMCNLFNGSVYAKDETSLYWSGVNHFSSSRILNALLFVATFCCVRQCFSQLVRWFGDMVNL